LEGVSGWAKFIGMWMVAAGVSLLYVFFRQYGARARYAYVFLLGCWAGLWGVNRLRGDTLTPGWLLWVIFLLGVAAMLRDSVARYRATTEELRAQRLERLRAPEGPESDDEDASG